LLIAGFSSTRPEAEAIRRGDQRLGATARDPDALILWADVFGAQAGDEQAFRIVGPDGAVLLDSTSVLEENNVSWFAFGGRARPPNGWTPGTHVGTYSLSRGGREIVVQEVEVAIVK
jgi:hypothetical protein